MLEASRFRHQFKDLRKLVIFLAKMYLLDKYFAQIFISLI